MALTPAQNTTLKNAINGDPTLSAYPNTPEGNTNMCNQQLNLNAAPAFIVWKTNLTLTQTGEVFNGAEWGALTTANVSRLQSVADYFQQGYSAADDDVRAIFNDIFSVGGVTKANLLVLWKRAALLGEKILAVGTGTDAAPAKMSFVGNLSEPDVTGARNS